MICLIVVPSLTRAGAETQAVDLANGLAARGHTVHLCCFEPELDQRNRLVEAVNFHHVKRVSKYNMSFCATVAEIIDRERVEVVQGILLFAVLVAWRAARLSIRKPPVVAAIHTTINRGWKQELQDRLIYRRILRSLPAVIFVCNHQRDHWITKFPELRPLARVIHNGVDVGRYQRDSLRDQALRLRNELGIPESAFVFSSIAGFRSEKGHCLLIEAFARLPINSYLMLAGDGPERAAIVSTIRKYLVGDRVRLLGKVTDVRPLIVASNATVLASTAVETFSIAMLESMALAVPLIASRIGGLPEAIIDGETGLLFPIGDVDALALGMKQMLARSEDVRMMGLAADRLVRACFTLEKMIDKYEDELREIVSATPRASIA